MTYSLDLRNKALKYIENRGTWRSASQVFGVAVRTLALWISGKKQNNLAPKTRKTGPYKIDENRLKDFTHKKSRCLSSEICKRIQDDNSCNFLCLQKRENHSKKKTPSYKERDEEKRGKYVLSLIHISEPTRPY